MAKGDVRKWEENPKTHPLWYGFQRWAEVSNVSLEDKEDWLAWWECYEEGVLETLRYCGVKLGGEDAKSR